MNKRLSRMVDKNWEEIRKCVIIRDNYIYITHIVDDMDLCNLIILYASCHERHKNRGVPENSGVQMKLENCKLHKEAE